MKKEYAKDDVTVVWQPDKCIHSAICVNGLPQVFNTKSRPWINVDGEEAKKIIAQVNLCPSRALSIKGDVEKLISENVNSIVAATSPFVIDLEPDKNYAWCSCGRSSNQPWCDGSHKVTAIKPIVFKLKTSQKAALCMCKQSGNKPYCDGTHNRIQG